MGSCFLEDFYRRKDTRRVSVQEVKLIIADIKKLNLSPEVILPQIAPCYVEKYHRFKVEQEARQELVTGYLLRKYLGVCEDGQLRVNEKKKPYLSKGKPFFNISHSENYVVLAIADCEVGVDIEKIRPFHEATARRVFSEEQLLQLQQMEETGRDEAFSKMWTGCEAVLKLYGVGFTIGWDEIKSMVAQTPVSSIRYKDFFISCAAEETIAITIEEIG